MNVSLNHIALVVSDFDLCLDFFVNLLGFTQKGDVDILEGDWADKLNGLKNVKAKHVTLAVGSTPVNFELLSFISPLSVPNDRAGTPNFDGFRHIGVLVDDLDTTMQNLQKHGYKFISKPQQPPGFGVTTVYFTGPEGIEIQLLQSIKKPQRTSVFNRFRKSWALSRNR